MDKAKFRVGSEDTSPKVIFSFSSKKSIILPWYIPLYNLTGLQSSLTMSALSHVAKSSGFPIVALSPRIWRDGFNFFNRVITISRVGPRETSFNKCISSIINKEISLIHWASCLINESNLSFEQTIKLELSKYGSFVSGSPMDREVII